jgi:hypothetical protein
MVLATAADPIIFVRLRFVIFAVFIIDILALKALNQRRFLFPVLAALTHSHISVWVQTRSDLFTTFDAFLDEIMH